MVRIRHSKTRGTVLSPPYVVGLSRKYIINGAKSIKDICKDCDRKQKLSICIKVLQHECKTLKPTSFTVDPTESNCQCRGRKFYGNNNKIHDRQMYLCPNTTVKFTGLDNIERSSTQPAFLIGQDLHCTQYRVRIFKHEDPASVEGQLTGFSLNELTYNLSSCGYYEYKPVYEGSENAIVSFRETGNMANYQCKRNNAFSSESDTEPLLV